MTDLTRNEPLKDIIYDALRQSILKGSIPVGTAINQKLIADYLNVSRTPIRAAINRLKHENLLEETIHGVTVKLISADTVSEIIQIFLALETIALNHAMHQMEQTDFEQIQYTLTNTIQANTEQDMTLVQSTLIEYNHTLVSYAQKPQLELFIEQIESYMRRLDNMTNLSPTLWTDLLSNYVVLVQCMEQKDAAALALILEDHFSVIETFIIEALVASNHKDQAAA